MRFFSGGLACLFFAFHFTAAAEPRQPTGPWHLDYGETRCMASRNYGTDDKPVFLALRPSVLGNSIEVSLIHNSRTSEVRHVPAFVALADERLSANALLYGAGERKSKVIRFNFPWPVVEKIRNSASIGFVASEIVDEELAIPDVGRLVDAMIECNNDLQEHWNVTAGTVSRIRTQASFAISPSSALESDDYPIQALREDVTGRVNIVLLIDETGKLRDCSVEESSGNASLDIQTCARLLERGRFNPAIDVSGQPVRSIYATLVDWRLP